MTESIPELPIEPTDEIASLLTEMHSQETPQIVIDQERSIIMAELNLSEYDGDDAILFNDEGWDSRVYMVNGGETVYKFPRSPYVMQGYSREIAALRMLENIDSEVVTQRFMALNPENHHFSYKGIVGTQLSELLGSLEVEDKRKIGSIVGSFLKEFHTLNLSGVPVVTINDEIEEYQSKYRLVLPIIEANFSVDEQSIITKFFFDLMPAEMEHLGSEMRLCHGDLGSYNIVIGDTGTTGIIDFGSVGYYDQSKDFIDLGDNVVLRAALEAYGDSALLRAKIAVRVAALPAIDLVYYMSKKDNRGIMLTVEKLRASLLSSFNHFGGTPGHE